MFKLNKTWQPRGVVAITSLMGILVFALAIMTTVSLLGLSELQMAKAQTLSEATFYAAEVGLNEALYRLISNPLPAPFSTSLDGININVTIAANPANPYQRIITAQATDFSGKIRTIEIIANTNSFSGGLDYAVQGGTGGVYLDNNSKIVGKVYSNGSILPASGGATGNITGEVWTADNHTINSVNIGGNAHAHNIVNSTIAGDAYYQTITSSLVTGLSVAGSTDPLPKDFPTKDVDVDNWKQEITDLGKPVIGPTVPATNCPGGFRDGTYYCVTSDLTGDNALGYQKINAKLYVANGVTLTLKGNLWVTGNIILENNGRINIHPLFGPLEPTPDDDDPNLGDGDAIIISDGIIRVSNNFNLSGTGDQHSALQLLSLSTNNTPSNPAIYASNNSTSVIFAAIHGMLKVKNGGNLNAGAAETLYLEPNAIVTYNPNLAAFNVPAGSEEPIGTALGTWREK